MGAWESKLGPLGIEPQPIAGNLKSYALEQNYPNPFNPSSTIKFSLPKNNLVRIDLYNTLGQRVKTILNKQMRAGQHEVEFKAQNLASGVYYYKIEAGDFQDMKKMVLIK
jgi:hypothetical protein